MSFYTAFTLIIDSSTRLNAVSTISNKSQRGQVDGSLAVNYKFTKDRCLGSNSYT